MNQFKIFKQSLSSRKVSTISCAIALFLFALLYAGLFKTMADQIHIFEKSFPQGLDAFFGSIATASTPEGWLNLELFGIFSPFVVAIAAITFGSAAIGKEEENHTLELILSTPTSRTKVLLQKTFAVLAQSLIISLFVYLGVALGSLIFQFHPSLVNTAVACLSLFLFGAFFGTLSLAVQALSGKKSAASGTSAGIFLLTYLSFVLSKLLDSLSWLRFTSPFHYFNSEGNLFGSFNMFGFLFPVFFSVIFILIAIVGFKRRDLSN